MDIQGDGIQEMYQNRKKVMINDEACLGNPCNTKY